MDRREELVEIDTGTAIISVKRRTYERLLKIVRPPTLLNDLAWWQRNSQIVSFEVREKRQEEPHGH